MIASDFAELVDVQTDDYGESVKAFNSILLDAVAKRASDLFLLADRDRWTISIRRLGLIEKLQEVSPARGRQLINVVKNLGHMDLVERRRPLDGRIELLVEDRQVDVRVNTIPTLFGEDATLRLLDPDHEVRSIDHLGLRPREKNRIVNLIDRPSGLVLVTGPTGVGKTTTLYACLSHLNNGVRKINTIEDPIEFSLPGVRQSQVNRAIDLDFSQLLASILRQAPDVVMVGEVRDAETAETAVRAANSGHLVFATLHAPVAAGAVQSMLALGAAPHFLASSLVGVIAQRLVRQLCTRCREQYDLPGTGEMFQPIASHTDAPLKPTIYGTRGCHECDNTGYIGRCGVFEVLTADRRIRDLISAARPRDELHQAAINGGMASFYHSALAAVAEGRTSVEEVVRVVPSQVLGFDG